MKTEFEFEIFFHFNKIAKILKGEGGKKIVFKGKEKSPKWTVRTGRLISGFGHEL